MYERGYYGSYELGKVLCWRPNGGHNRSVGVVCFVVSHRSEELCSWKVSVYRTEFH